MQNVAVETIAVLGIEMSTLAIKADAEAWEKTGKH